MGPAPGVVSGLEDDPEGTRIVGEELKLLSTVLRALEAAAAAHVSVSRGRALDDERLLELRDDVSVAKPEDLPALFEQMHHLGALRAQPQSVLRPHASAGAGARQRTTTGRAAARRPGGRGTQ
jgi:DNA helicase-2/ATP-dependent DNA helicase PcrA